MVFDDDRLDEIERRNKEAISRKTGYKFVQNEPEMADGFLYHMVNEELTDPEGNATLRRSLDRKNREYDSFEGDGWLDINWR